MKNKPYNSLVLRLLSKKKKMTHLHIEAAVKPHFENMENFEWLLTMEQDIRSSNISNDDILFPNLANLLKTKLKMTVEAGLSSDVNINKRVVCCLRNLWLQVDQRLKKDPGALRLAKTVLSCMVDIEVLSGKQFKEFKMLEWFESLREHSEEACVDVLIRSETIYKLRKKSFVFIPLMRDILQFTKSFNADPNLFMKLAILAKVTLSMYKRENARNEYCIFKTELLSHFRHIPTYVKTWANERNLDVSVDDGMNHFIIKLNVPLTIKAIKKDGASCKILNNNNNVEDTLKASPENLFKEHHDATASPRQLVEPRTLFVEEIKGNKMKKSPVDKKLVGKVSKGDLNNGLDITPILVKPSQNKCAEPKYAMEDSEITEYKLKNILPKTKSQKLPEKGISVLNISDVLKPSLKHESKDLERKTNKITKVPLKKGNKAKLTQIDNINGPKNMKDELSGHEEKEDSSTKKRKRVRKRNKSKIREEEKQQQQQHAVINKDDSQMKKSKRRRKKIPNNSQEVGESSLNTKEPPLNSLRKAQDETNEDDSDILVLENGDDDLDILLETIRKDAKRDNSIIGLKERIHIKNDGKIANTSAMPMSCDVTNMIKFYAMPKPQKSEITAPINKRKRNQENELEERKDEQEASRSKRNRRQRKSVSLSKEEEDYASTDHSKSLDEGQLLPAEEELENETKICSDSLDLVNENEADRNASQKEVDCNNSLNEGSKTSYKHTDATNLVATSPMNLSGTTLVLEERKDEQPASQSKRKRRQRKSKNINTEEEENGASTDHSKSFDDEGQLFPAEEELENKAKICFETLDLVNENEADRSASLENPEQMEVDDVTFICRKTDDQDASIKQKKVDCNNSINEGSQTSPMNLTGTTLVGQNSSRTNALENNCTINIDDSVTTDIIGLEDSNSLIQHETEPLKQEETPDIISLEINQLVRHEREQLETMDASEKLLHDKKVPSESDSAADITIKLNNDNDITSLPKQSPVKKELSDTGSHEVVDIDSDSDDVPMRDSDSDSSDSDSDSENDIKSDNSKVIDSDSKNDSVFSPSPQNVLRVSKTTPKLTLSQKCPRRSSRYSTRSATNSSGSSVNSPILFPDVKKSKTQNKNDDNLIDLSIESSFNSQCDNDKAPEVLFKGFSPISKVRHSPVKKTPTETFENKLKNVLVLELTDAHDFCEEQSPEKVIKNDQIEIKSAASKLLNRSLTITPVSSSPDIVTLDADSEEGYLKPAPEILSPATEGVSKEPLTIPNTPTEEGSKEPSTPTEEGSQEPSTPTEGGSQKRLSLNRSMERKTPRASITPKIIFKPAESTSNKKSDEKIDTDVMLQEEPAGNEIEKTDEEKAEGAKELPSQMKRRSQRVILQRLGTEPETPEKLSSPRRTRRSLITVSEESPSRNLRPRRHSGTYTPTRARRLSGSSTSGISGPSTSGVIARKKNLSTVLEGENQDSSSD